MSVTCIPLKLAVVGGSSPARSPQARIRPATLSVPSPRVGVTRTLIDWDHINDDNACPFREPFTRHEVLEEYVQNDCTCSVSLASCAILLSCSSIDCACYACIPDAGVMVRLQQCFSSPTVKEKNGFHSTRQQRTGRNRPTFPKPLTVSTFRTKCEIGYMAS
jgi:hypothetical protein